MAYLAEPSSKNVPVLLRAASLPIVLNLNTLVVIMAVKLTQPSMQLQQKPIIRALNTQTPSQRSNPLVARSNRVMP